MSANVEILYVIVVAGAQRYAVRYDDITLVRSVEMDELETLRDPRGRPLMVRALHAWLYATAEMPVGRCHALIVPLRRRSVALLVERVEEMTRFTVTDIQPLPVLVRSALEHGWLSGVVSWEGQPILVLDAVQIARDIITAEIAPSG